MADSLEMLQGIAQLAGAGVITIDHDGVVRSFSAGAEQLFGYLASDVIGRNVTMLMPEEFRQDHGGHLDDYVGSGSVREVGPNLPLWGLRRDGTTFAMRLSVGDLETQGRSLYVGMVVDVSTDLAGERALQESESRFRQLVENIEEVFILRTTAPYRYVYISPAIERLFGLTASEAIADPGYFLSFTHPDDLDFVRRAMHEAGDAPETEVEYRIIRADGETRWVWTRYRHVEVDEGETPLLAIVVSDVTAQKEAQHAELSARNEAERANAAKTEFLSRMSHELRTPMNAILGFAQLLEIEVETDGQRESVRQILKGGRHLLELINEVLDISRIDAGQLALSPEPVFVADVVSEVVDLVAPLARGRNISLATTPGLDCHEHVLADRQRFTQVLLNLVSNSIKYNRRDGEIRLSCATRASRAFALTVSDTGIGMSESEVRRLFTPFDRLGRESTGEEGTGVGLALSQRLVHLMGGTIEVESEPGVGSRFTVVLPLAESAIGSDGASLSDVARDASSSPVGGAPFTPVTVAYIEDNLANVRLMERLVERRTGVSLIHAMQGRLGLDLVASSMPDLIFLDLHLPDMSGEEVLRRLRADDATRGIPIVVVSADATPGQVQRIVEMGATGYLVKPFDIEEVLARLDEVQRDKEGLA